ncbi:MAG TPA: methyltransferase domain-containing protein, partial [Longilinea sp.]|nr:methyltransferase domain-containing protein [Longilinea sp.]
MEQGFLIQMALSIDQWHRRYLQQAAWTQAARQYLFEKAGISHCSKVLEVGCGTGAIIQDFQKYPGIQVTGVDFQYQCCQFTKTDNPIARVITANGLHLPFQDHSFDLTFCHFFLLWCGHPEGALREMARVTKTGGSILLLAEPDHEHRIDLPKELHAVGEKQTASLSSQGADVSIGSRLGEWLYAAGINVNLVGLLSSEWAPKPPGQDFDLEWQIIFQDLNKYPTVWLERMKEVDKAAHKLGT